MLEGRGEGVQGCCVRGGGEEAGDVGAEEVAGGEEGERAADCCCCGCYEPAVIARASLACHSVLL